MIWAAGEYQYPDINAFTGSELCLHNSKIDSWKNIKGNEFYVIGGNESGIDAAINLSRMGKKVTVLGRRKQFLMLTGCGNIVRTYGRHVKTLQTGTQ